VKRSDDHDATDGSAAESDDSTSGPRTGDSVDEFVPELSDEGDQSDGADVDAADGPSGASSTPASTDRAVRSDGGTVDSPFETTASIQETRLERLSRFFRDFVRTPLSIVLSDWRGVAGLLILGFYIAVGLFGTHFVGETYPAHGGPLVGPFETMDHPLGTTATGKDLLSMMVYSTAPILIMMGSGATFTVVVGSVFGVVAGYKGGWVDTVLSSITDVFINLPGLPLVVVLATLLEDYIRDPVILGMLLAVAAWAGLARALRSQVLTLRSESFVESARAMDLSTRWILTREILPHLMPYIAVNMVNAARRVIFAAVALYFLGVLPFSSANWGVILSNAYSAGALYRADANHWILIPMITISSISVGLILLAQSLDRVFNPRARARHEGGGGETSPEGEEDGGATDMMKV
jgi:peptide/nickel transport system permease protein